MEKVTDTKSASNEGALLFSYFNEIGIISQLSGALFQSVLPEGLTQAQFHVLNWFNRVDTQATPGRLAKAFQVTPGAMTNTLGKLEHRQLIKIAPDPTSGRKKRVTMTAKGNEMCERAINATAPLLVELAEKLDTESMLNQIQQLAEIRKYLDERRYSQEK
jgi:DNA-binding MarR family transcriptional regulator